MKISCTHTWIRKAFGRLMENGTSFLCRGSSVFATRVYPGLARIAFNLKVSSSNGTII